MVPAENVERFLSREQLAKLEEQLTPVCLRHCPSSAKCARGVLHECPVEAYIGHLRRHTRTFVVQLAGAEPEYAQTIRSIASNELEHQLAMPGCSRIKTKLRKMSMVADRLQQVRKGDLGLSLREVRNLMDELHEFDSMIRDTESMLLRNHFYTQLDSLTEVCRSLEEDLRWAVMEREQETSRETGM
ncbi:MAG TPA: hypothetical protein HA257_00630 [Candidatus Methanoperedenaceae archaeon]|nr:hypothetical protein [Candidatus Methanoperedenaceae archaeon]